MAQFDVSTEQLKDPAGWPDCCARCGAAGTTLVPMPARSAKKIDGVRVPFCDKHRDDFEVRGHRTRIGVAAVLVGMAFVAVSTWVLHPHLGGPFAGNNSARGLSTLLIGIGSAFPLVLIALAWAGTPVRVTMLVGRVATVGGVCPAFRDAVKARGPRGLPDAPDEATFEVSLYRPKASTPAGASGLLFGAAVVTGAVLGGLFATFGRSLAPDAVGWDPLGWGYVLPAGAAAAFVAWTGLGASSLFSLPSLVSAVGFAVIYAAMAAAAKLCGFSPYMWFAAAYSFAPLLALQALVLYPIIWHGRVRHGVIAGVCGALAPLAYTGLVYAVAGTGSGPQSAALVLGPIAVLIMAGANFDTARSPYCEQCGGWLVKRRIGSFARTRAEMEPAVAGGEIVSLARETPSPKKAEIGDTELTSYSCDGCEADGTVVLELHDCVKGGKHGNTPTLKRVDRYLYPGPALPVVNKLFPPAEVKPLGGAGE